MHAVAEGRVGRVLADGPGLRLVLGGEENAQIKSGETLHDVAYRHRLGFQAVARANPGVDPWIPEPGTTLTLPTRVPAGVHGQFRHVRMTRDGHFLVAHMDLGKVVEYGKDGKELWSVAAPSAWAAVRLRNGNTLISGNQHGYVREVNRHGEVVWEIGKNDLPGISLYTVQEVTRLANGNTLINNWVGSVAQENWPTVVQLIEVTPDKKVVWALRDWTTLGPASSTQLLDEPGAAERGQQER